ncbi:endonuclease III domain-containing protein [Sphingomonas solaris]|uniref:endonuclease III domain-containing protein n=1 Tax=Alterirhizorhabdus solaris TaxID=2529389 RepID=UPI00139695F9|nr:endonuclease [Sphingomonas solaris]
MARWAGLLRPLSPDPATLPRRTVIGQLIKSLISSRTRDEVSIPAYRALGARFGSAAGIARASVAEIGQTIAAVTFPEVKAERLAAALAMVAADRPDFDLAFLGEMTQGAAMAWLERLPGVGCEVAAAALNVSRLSCPVFVVDTHTIRILRRLGFAGPAADSRAIMTAVMEAVPDWTGDDFLWFHMGIKRLGQTVCRHGPPDCPRCPLRADCPTARATPAGDG